MIAGCRWVKQARGAARPYREERAKRSLFYLAFRRLYVPRGIRSFALFFCWVALRLIYLRQFRCRLHLAHRDTHQLSAFGVLRLSLSIGPPRHMN